MMAHCGICLKTTSNNKGPLCLVTVDGETKLQFGYYYHHKTDLNRSLVDTKVHVTCYKRYWDKWYSTCVRNVTTLILQVALSIELRPSTTSRNAMKMKKSIKMRMKHVIYFVRKQYSRITQRLERIDLLKAIYPMLIILRAVELVPLKQMKLLLQQIH